MATSWRQIGLASYRSARRAHNDLHIDTSQRIDPFGALVLSGVVVIRRALDGVAGIYMPGIPGAAAAGVMVNVNHPEAKQRYTAAHELGHHLRDAAAIVDTDTEWMARGAEVTTDRERYAESFASWFLMPPDLVAGTAQRLNIAFNHMTAPEAYRLSLDLGTSYRATIHHLRSLGLITATSRAALIRVAPATIKESLGVRGAVEDLRRDVWQITPGHVSQILGKPGDVLSIELTEIPSSGYSWMVEVPAGLGLIGDFYGAGPRTYGDSGQRRFLVRIESSGERVLRLEHERPWESERLDTRVVQVHAQPVPSIGLVEPAQAILSGA